ncbi:MAG: hypothetical protein KAV87_53305 [Desulfobacteraceae bacterium]|nr:hypothetical protein [Desulfobacteraceae bacterium]
MVIMGLDEIVGKYKGPVGKKKDRSPYAVPVLDNGYKRLVSFKRLPRGGYDVVWDVYDMGKCERQPGYDVLPSDADSLFDMVMNEVDQDIGSDIGYSVMGYDGGY